MAGQPDLFALAVRGEWDIAAAWRLAILIRRLRPDILHVHEPHGVAIAAIACRLAGRHRPLVVLSRRVAWGISGNRFSRWKYRSMDGYFAISEAVRRQVIADGIPPQRVTLVHEGVETERIAALSAADVKSIFGLPRGALVVGSVAALSPEKGLSHLIDAAAVVIEQVPEASFVICGKGDSRQELEEQIGRLGLRQRVILAGFRTDVHELLKSFDLYVMSSLHEGLCTSLIDAMAAGKPAVATAVGGIPEVLVEGETGYLVPPADPQALADKIVELLRDEPLRQRFGAAGKARASELFDVEKMVRDTLAGYQDLLAAKAASQ